MGTTYATSPATEAISVAPHRAFLDLQQMVTGSMLNVGGVPNRERAQPKRARGETRPGGQEQRSQWHGQQHCLA